MHKIILCVLNILCDLICDVIISCVFEVAMRVKSMYVKKIVIEKKKIRKSK